jgi:glycosyltransferase involved in cell wall biosynthesis
MVMKVAVAVHGRFHGFELASYLHARGLLERLFTTYPAFAARRFVAAGLPLATVPWLEAVRRLHPRLSLPGRPDLFIARQFARHTARHLPAADLLVSWSGASLEAIAPARARGMKVVVERGSTHIAHQSDTLRDAHARFGLAWDDTDPRLIERELAEYEAADLIVTGSSAARATFLARGLAAGKVAANPYGVDLSRFRPADGRGRESRKRLLFIGRVGVRKGVPWLIEAFARLPSDWELHLVGPLDAGIEAVFARLPMERVVVRGAVPSSSLPEEHRAADAFCLPSLEEGLALVVLQAMASGLPVVATDATGIGDAGRDGRDFLTVPPADTAALAESLLRLADDEPLCRRLGLAARASVVQGFGWDDYGARALALWRRHLGVD